MVNDHLYLGLLRSDGTEPPAESGYHRVEVTTTETAYVDTVAFPEVRAPGYGNITDVVLYDQLQNGNIVLLLPQPFAQDVHTGIIPFVRDGQLYRGVDVSASFVASMADDCKLH